MKPVEVRVTLTEVARELMPQASDNHITELAGMILRYEAVPTYIHMDCQALLDVALRKAKEKS